jgi:signal transduction histidine kinase
MAGTTVRTAAVQPLLDVAVPVALAVLAVTQLLSDRPPGDPALLTVFALAAVLPLVARRRAPLLVTAAVMVGVVGQVVVTGGVPATFASFVATMVCVYTLAREARPAEMVAGFGLVAAGVTTITLWQARVESFQPFEFVYPLVYFGLAGGLGALVRQRAMRLAAVQDRATALEGELAREAELAAAEERARIARDLHDVVAHGLSLMVVQAEAAEELLERSPDDAARPIRSVQTTGRQALAEMRRLLGVLRESGDRAGTAPQPGLHRLPDLVGEAADLGLRVELTSEGDLTNLSPGLSLAAYRIIQEALTNTRRHAHATSARVRVEHAGEAVRIEVSDDGHGPAGSRPGHGLIGMRERVALYGGRVESGPGDGGGFRVSAVLPTGEPGR